MKATSRTSVVKVNRVPQVKQRQHWSSQKSNGKLTNFEINVWEVVKVGGVIN